MMVKGISNLHLQPLSSSHSSESRVFRFVLVSAFVRAHFFWHLMSR